MGAVPSIKPNPFYAQGVHLVLGSTLQPDKSIHNFNLFILYSFSPILFPPKNVLVCLEILPRLIDDYVCVNVPILHVISERAKASKTSSKLLVESLGRSTD